ncbi:hypothetical protein [Fictibacillus sp. KU28468]|uniref:hypothetical protein n=1 Tax=Fictibacillus sp. KU28468 TaxID=2991053 RepID=UPI00223DD216|nr:hypothetical protein [Fictibacillus sp. KU28468]UZJ78747.1 hypothetical protein OKX00_21990 [Fictibacillus sp. KU28468]
MVENKIGWSSAENTDNSRSGLNHAGIENFKDNPLYHVPRELTQDALDAKDPKKDGPVLLEFKTFTVKKDESLFKLDELTGIIESIRGSWENDPKTYKHFDKMYNTMKVEEEIVILAVRDSNTIGLSDVTSDDEGTWNSLVKSSGHSDKPAGSNGSRGLGKHAPFLASRYSAVLYGTLNKQGEMGFQGVAKLATYKKDGIKYRENIYYGIKNGYKPITDLSFLPDDFKRKEVGTDKFIFGFKFDENWKDHFVKVISENFLLAFYEEKLIVNVDGKEISKDTLPDIIEEICQSEPSGHHIIKEFYTALTEGQPFSLVINIKDVVEQQPVLLYLAKGDEFSNTISMNRSSGMKIFNKDNFRKPPVRFVGFLTIKGPDLNKILSETETATHKGWHVNINENSEDEEVQKNKEIKRVIEKIDKWISGNVHGLAPKIKKESIDLIGLEQILPKKSDKSEPLAEISEEALKEKIKSIKIVPLSFSQRELIKTKKKKRKNNPNPTPKPPNPNPKPPREKKGNVSKVRSIYDEINEFYKVVITPKVTGNVKLQIQAMGENGRFVDISLNDVKLRKGNQLTTVSLTDNVVGPLGLVKDERCELQITLNELTPYSLEVHTV